MAEIEYAAAIGPKVIEFYEDFFATPFPLEKMDMAAIPDFAVLLLSPKPKDIFFSADFQRKI